MCIISMQYDKVDCLYNINSADNLKSIIKLGLLSKNEMAKRRIGSIDLSNKDVQLLRSKVKIRDTHLHEYVNLYFSARNPMMYYLTKNMDIRNLCVLCIDKTVLDIESTIVADRNAAASLVSFSSPQAGLSVIYFELVFAKSWNDENIAKKDNKKAVKCAEVLVYKIIPRAYFRQIVVASEAAKIDIDALNLNINVVVDKEMFFL